MPKIITRAAPVGHRPYTPYDRSALPLPPAKRRERQKTWTRWGRYLWRNTTAMGKSRMQRMTPAALIKARHRTRVQQADKFGFMPPLDTEATHPRPADGRCECCGAKESKLVFDHNHRLIGEFLGWCCVACNSLGDDVKRLEARIRYLKARGES